MGFVKRLKNGYAAFKGTSESLSHWQELADFLGLDVSQTDNLSEATYFTCLKVLSESMGKMPCRLLQRDMEKGGVRVAREKPLFNALYIRPNPYMTASTFWSTIEFNRNHYGNAYALITGAGTSKKPMQLWILPSQSVNVVYDDGKLLNEYEDVYYQYGDYTFSSEEVLHFKSHATFNGVLGMSVAQYLEETLDGGKKSQKFINNMYKNGFTAKAVLQYTGSLNDENVKRLVRGIDKYARGEMGDELKNILPIPVGQTITPLNIKLTEAQYLEVRQYTATQIASAFGIKPYQIGDYGKESYSSQSAQQLSFYVDTMLYITRQYEEEITYKLLSQRDINKGFHFKFDNSGVLTADFQTMVGTLASATSTFLLTPNEAREKLDLPTVTGGDELLGNGAAIPVRYAGSQYVKDDSGEGGEENEQGLQGGENPEERDSGEGHGGDQPADAGGTEE